MAHSPALNIYFSLSHFSLFFQDSNMETYRRAEFFRITREIHRKLIEISTLQPFTKTLNKFFSLFFALSQALFRPTRFGCFEFLYYVHTSAFLRLNFNFSSHFSIICLLCELKCALSKYFSYFCQLISRFFFHETSETLLHSDYRSK